MYFTKMREIAERLARLDNKNSQAKIDLGYAYRWTGTSELISDPDAAVEWYRKAITITREALSKTPDSVNFRWQNAARSLEFAEALKRADKPSEAVSQAQIARDTLIGLGVSQQARREFQRLLLASDCMLSDLHHELGSSVSSLSYQNSAMDVLTSVRSGGPDLYVDQTLAGCHDVFSRVDSRRASGLRRVWSLNSSDNRVAVRLQMSCGFRLTKSVSLEAELEIDLPVQRPAREMPQPAGFFRTNPSSSACIVAGREGDTPVLQL
jgi:hypothetical protein